MRLILKKFFNTSVLASPAKAMRLYKILSLRVKNGKTVNLDFLGIQATTIAFLYIVFSNLIKECQKNIKEIKGLIYISNASVSLMQEIEYLKENYKQVGKKIDPLKLSFV